MVKKLQKLSLLLIGLIWTAYSPDALAQINLSGGNYTENFDGMGSTTTLPTGWAAIRMSGNGTVGERLSPEVSNGDSNSGNVYNVGATGSSDRALGSLASGTTIPAFGVSFTNGTNNDITRLSIAGVMEQWKTGSASDVNEVVTFEYSTNATSLNTGTWVAVSSLNLVEKQVSSSSAAAINGNADTNKTAINGAIDLLLRSGEIVWFRWTDNNDVGNDGMYALDDLTVTPTYSAVDNVPPSLISTTPVNGAANVATQLDIVLNFSELVLAGTGQVTLSWDGGSISRSATDPEVEYNGEQVIIKNIALQPGITYTATVDNRAFKDVSGNFFAGISGSSYTFTTSATGTPTISTSESSLTFPLTETMRKSAGAGYDLSAMYLQGPVTVSVNGPYQISKTNEETNYGTASLTYTQAELAAAQKVYVRFAPESTTDNTGTITHTSAGAQEVTVTLSGTAYNPNFQNFDACSSALPGGWTQYSITGAQTWSCTTFGQTGNAVQMSGFSGGNQTNEDWLISPPVDLSSGYTYPVLSFWSRTAFAGAPLKLMVSTNYSGTGSPTANGVTWAELNGQFPAENSNVWKETLNVDLSNFKQSNVYIAFVYNSTTSAAPRWTIDDVAITNSNTMPPASLVSSLNYLANADFGIVAPGTTVDKTFTFNINGLHSEVTLEAPEQFILSKNGTDFSRSITFTQAEGASNTFTVRFTAPNVTDKAFAGPVTFAAENLNQTVGYLTASVLDKDRTFDVVTWNIEWFGSTGQGPSNETLQRDNVKKVIEALDADVYAFQEISNETAFNELKALLPAYDGFMSAYANNSQEVAYFYKRATVNEVHRRYLLQGTTGIQNFWASGRYPYLLEVDATINGISKRIHLINIHAKANESGSPEVALNAYNRRRVDVQVLKDSLDRYFPTANIIMLGDYNDDIDFTVADISSPTASTYQSFVDDVNRYRFASMPLSQAGLRSYVTRDNVIDHIMYSNELQDYYITNSARVVIPFDIVNASSADYYTSTTSDHLPVMARFNFTGPLGIEDKSYAAGFKVYPNPSTGTVQLALPSGMGGKAFELQLYSLTGEVLLKTNGNADAVTNRLNQKLSAAAAGMYLVRVKAAGNTYQVRIVKN
ncbi:T9SS-dependent choice-of-anchor J family protein [Rufibacter roseus]|uniref:T9SS-dependent choice-of-anchor J family protein n=1 Tax=Rufibacter roseus TaxID=1567108 RepID=A0ABW2DJD1_9BACT|nr:choice-of-anchor J domain-containing protein [Rufibacter roseus]